MKRLARLPEGRANAQAAGRRVADRGVAVAPGSAAVPRVGPPPDVTKRVHRSGDCSGSGAVALMASFLVGWLGAMVVDWLRTTPSEDPARVVSERAEAEVQAPEPTAGTAGGEPSEHLDEASIGAADLPVWSTAPQGWGR